MGLFGGSSRSNSTTNNTTTTGTVANYGQGPSQSFAGVNAGGDIAIETSDYGAIEAGTSLAEQALLSNGQALVDTINAVSAAGQRESANAQGIVNRTLDIASKTQVSESAQFQDTLLKLGLIIGAVLGLKAFAKGAK